MKKFIAEESRKAFGRLRAFVLFTVKCILASLINLLILILPVVIAGIFTARAFQGLIRPGFEAPVSHQPVQTQMLERKPAVSAQDVLRFISQDLRSWIYQFKRFKI